MGKRIINFVKRNWIFIALLALGAIGFSRFGEVDRANIYPLFGLFAIAEFLHIPLGIGLWFFSVVVCSLIIWKLFKSEGRQSKIVWILFGFTAFVFLILLILEEYGY